MSYKQIKRTKRTHAEPDNPELPVSDRLGLDILRIMPEFREDHTQGATNDFGTNDSERPKAIRLGIDLARKLFHRSQHEQLDASRRMDRIFYVHATNEEHKLHKRRTEENLRQRMKFDISRPITSPPAPETPLMRKYRDRQADWKKRSIAMKNRQSETSQPKRWSLRTWKIQSGREQPAKKTPQRPRKPNEPVRSLSKSLETKATSIREETRTGRKRTLEGNLLRNPEIEIAVESLSNPLPSSLDNGLPKAMRKRGTTLREQRWSPVGSPTELDVIGEHKSHPAPFQPTHRHAASATNIPRRLPTHQVAKKAASMGNLRPQNVYDNHLAVPARPGMPTINNKRYVQPAFRTQAALAVNADGRQKSHLALRTQPSSDLGTTNQRLIHPALRTQPGPGPGTTDQRLIHPALQTQPATALTASLSPVSSTFAGENTERPIPRVRIIPPSTFIDPNDLATAYAERAMVYTKPPTMCDQLALLGSMNATRAIAKAAPLDLHPLLSIKAQDYVALQLPPLPPPKPSPPAYRRQIIKKHAKCRPTQIEEVDFRSPSHAYAVRLISPPGLGSLRCGSLWDGGKYRRHKDMKSGQDPAYHRFSLLPIIETDDRDSIMSEENPVHDSSGSCHCVEYDAWVAVTDKRWRSVGIGRAEDGRWVVELWEPDAGGARSHQGETIGCT